MKCHLFTSLFLLLLANTPLSLPLGLVPQRFKPFPKGSVIKVEKDSATQALESLFDNLTKQNGSASNPTFRIKGLASIKRYLYEFGHYHNPMPFTDFMTYDVKLAIQNYQKFFNLQVTGQLDEVTRQHILTQRCGVPDSNYRFGFNLTNTLSWPKGSFPRGKRNLTYGFVPESQIPRDVMDIFRRAFQRWSQAMTALNLTEAATFDEADIKVGYYQMEREFQTLVVGDSVMELKRGVGHNVVGEIRLDFNKNWAMADEDGIDLEAMAMHQIGHILGLDHSRNVSSVMHPLVLGWRRSNVVLGDDDVGRVKELYANGESGCGCGFPTILSLCFAFLVFMS